MNVSLRDPNIYTAEYVVSHFPRFFAALRAAEDIENARERLSKLIAAVENDVCRTESGFGQGARLRSRDCAEGLRNLVRPRSEQLAEFPFVQGLLDVAAGRPRGDLQPAFFADLYHLLLGLYGRAADDPLSDIDIGSFAELSGRDAAIARSAQLDALWEMVETWCGRYASGLDAAAISAREARRARIMAALGGSPAAWNDWRWQIKHIIRDADQLAEMVTLSAVEREAVSRARRGRLPFGITPYYLSLMDEEPGGERDRAVRAQVIPPPDYVERMTTLRDGDSAGLDFMREADTSPVDLITRRYPAICIFKPFNTCPQICVYCQRNWEIDDAMMPGAMASEEQLETAFKWLADHPAIREVLVTGGDPLAMDEEQFERILLRVAALPQVERLRVGTRTPVTMPTRITERLAAFLGSLRRSGRREVALVTHVQHVAEITPELVAAIDRLRCRGIPVYNQHVYTFYTSRRFEAVALRRLLRLAGIDPYYTFNTKGKEETLAYRVPIARLLQEQREEARLLPGIGRTDEAVYNVPGLGKHYLRAARQRDLVGLLPDGTRVFEFYPWEQNIVATEHAYIGHDVPILDYLRRLEAVGERAADYHSIWYYF
ncbi:MAG: KamA family radical SAM protein [Deltaproteobacteria bacterium]|nr:KamA family radical SAM protein [Candidatus Anaeroferrophillacea bacterium]